MLLLFLPVAWLAVLIVTVAVCQAAARGDAALARALRDAPNTPRQGQGVSERGAARVRYPSGSTARPGSARSLRARAAAARRGISHAIR